MELGPFGASEIVVIAALALVLFGPRRLGELGRAAGRTLTRLRRASNELKVAFASELDQVGDEARTARATGEAAVGPVRSGLQGAGETASREASGLLDGIRALEADVRRDWEPGGKPGGG